MNKIDKKIYILISIVFIVLASIFVYKYIKNESPIYIYDYSGYHEIYKSFSEMLLDSPEKFLRDFSISISSADYNCMPIIFLIPFYMVFKGSRFGYILGSCLLYVVPVIMLSIAILREIIIKNEKIDRKSELTFTIFFGVISFLYTRWWSPTLRGLPDIIALIPLSIAALISFKYSFSEKQKIYIPFVIGFMMYLCFLFRRYFVYAIIGFYVALVIKELIKVIKEKNEKKQIFINIVKNTLIAGCTTLFLTVLIQLPLVKTILEQNYSQSYSAYQISIFSHIKRTVDEFGYVILFFAIIGIIYTLKNKEHREKGIFCLINIVVSYGSFMTVQAMGVHHYLIISLWFFILFIYGIYGVWKILKKEVSKNIFLIIILILMVLNFSTTYIFRNLNIPILTQNNKYCKFYYKNLDELNRLIKDLDCLLDDKNVKFSTLASSINLSDNLLELLGTEKMKRSIVYTSTIDLRDGVNFNSLMSEYVIVTDIAQTASSSTGQRIVSVPNDAIINETGIGKAYKRITDSYILQGGVKAYIYEKCDALHQKK